MSVAWQWRPRLKIWQLVSDGKRRKVIKGKPIATSRRVEITLREMLDGQWRATYWNYDPVTFRQSEGHSRIFPTLEEAKAVTLMETSLKGNT